MNNMHTSSRFFGSATFRKVLQLVTVWAILSVVITPVGLGTSIAHAANSSSNAYEPGQILVKFKPTRRMANLTQAVAQSDFQNLKIQQVVSEIPQDNLYRVYFNTSTPVSDVINEMQNVEGVDYATPNYIYKLQDVSNSQTAVNSNVSGRIVNDSYRSNQYYLDRSSIPQSWNITTGSKVTVAVEDSGVELNHPDLQGRILSSGYNFVDKNKDVNDVLGHGTQVSGIIAADSNNNFGIAGISWAANIMPIKIADPQGVIDVNVAAEGIYYAIAHGVRILNLSYGGESSSPVLKDAINYALANQAIIIAAGGNAPDGMPEYPAAYPGVIAVTATDETDRVAFFDSYGSYITLGAPGVDIMTTSLNNSNLGDYSEHSGTSFSTPVVTGVVALMLSINPNLTAEQVRQALVATTDKVYPTNDDFYKDYGAGRLNAYHALQYISSVKTAPLPVDAPILPPAHLMLSQQLTPNTTVKAGDLLKLQVNVLNSGKGAADHIYINVPIDSALQLQYVTTPPHNTNMWVSNVSSDYFTMQLGKLDASSAISFTVVYKVKPDTNANTNISIADSGNWNDATGGGSSVANTVAVTVGQNSVNRTASYSLQEASPASGQAGQTFQLNTDGFTAGETVGVWLNKPDGSILGLPSVQANNQGQIAVSFDSTNQTQAGDYSIVACGHYSNAEFVAHFTLNAPTKK